ncbi:MAG: transglycosylase domain-containing protein, partial [Clostridia bacterium]|nr:transglycosylase domain-containing protein [Clostridia bacterium]
MAHPTHRRTYYPAGGMAMQSKKQIVKRIILIVAIVATLALGGFAYVDFDVPSWQTLDVNKLTNLAQTGAIYDKDGAYVTTLVGTENRTVIDMDDLPRHVVDAFLAAEDLRFYKHP